MRNNIAFRLSAQNSLRMNEVTHKQQKNLLNTFKAGSDLRTQLNKVKPLGKTGKFDGTGTFEKEHKKMEEEVLAQEVAALQHFRAPVSRDKTKNLIEGIKLRRREQHIDTLNRFQEDVDDYRENLVNAYESLINDIDQVMSIKLSAVQEYLASCDTPQYLLSREKEIVEEMHEQVANYRIECESKLNYAKEELQRIRNDRSNMAEQICQDLRMAIVEIAFVLEPEAIEIEKQERQGLEDMESKAFNEYCGRLDKIIEEQNSRNQRVENSCSQVVEHWKAQKQQFQISKYLEEADSDYYRRPHFIRNTFNRLMQAQMHNHERKVRLLQGLFSQNPDALSKANIDKVTEALKKINDMFDNSLDELLVEFKNGNNHNKEQNHSRLQHCRSRLLYIGKNTPEEVEKILDEKCVPLCNRNISENEELIKKSTNNAEDQDDRETKVIQNLIKMILKVGVQNDGFVKQFAQLNQKYEMQKAKILDDDEELLDKLKQQLEQLKKQLKEAEHHIKLEDIEKKCFEKVDEIEKAYRLCHDKNKALKQTRTPSLQEFMKQYQSQLAQILELFGPSRRAQLEQKNKKQAEQAALKRIQFEDKKKAEEDQKLAEEAKAKGGKAPPPPKPKDPKKAAAQLEERKKQILAEIGVKKIEEVKTDTGSIWLVYKSINQICQAFYRQAVLAMNESKAQLVEVKPEAQNAKALDSPQQELKDCRNMPVVNSKAFLRLEQLVPLMQSLRTKIFEAVSQKKQRIINQSEQLDQEMLEESLINLDNRLKQHYSLKGTIESTIFVKRSGQITGHKKKYEKYARTIKEKIDLQTQKFNFLLEKGLQMLKNHIAEQKSMKEGILKCKNLSELQGLHSRTKQNYSSFGLTIRQIYNQLERLSHAQVDTLLAKNQQFIKQSKLMKDGGDYSAEEIAWYDKMMSEITAQVKQQQDKRKQKLVQLREHGEKRKEELYQSFQKEYEGAVGELAARDGTGKKYGRPKRIAQQKTRLEMNKCEQAQINIDAMIRQLNELYEKAVTNNFEQPGFPEFLAWRKKLMTVQSCIMRYSKHIDALKSDLKTSLMIRVNYNFKNPEAKLTPEQEEEDKKRKQEQLKMLGKLSEQKDERNFMKYIEEIEKIISEDSRSIYTGDKAKYLTGNDKIPDFLRVYIANMKKSAETFRVSCVRELRESCLRFSDLSANLSELFFSSKLSYFTAQATDIKNKVLKKFNEMADSHKKLRELNIRKLRPNLLNPKCQDQLKQLDKIEGDRNSEHIKVLSQIGQQYKDSHFKNAEEFLSCLLNNYEFLLLLTDAFYLAEDFVKLPGDEIEQRTHLDAQKLLIMKQKGIKIDPNSERNLRKKWEGLDYRIFDIENRKYEYKKAQQAPKEKDKKGGKKDSKDNKKQEEVVLEADANKSKTIETYKTWRQKSVFEARQRVKNSFKAIYDRYLAEVTSKLQIERKENQVFWAKWREVADSLYIK